MKIQHTHRERQQPANRKHLGFLEKKKDYKLRADDHNEKAAALKVLRQKALDKNPDEFSFKMLNSKLVDGVHKRKLKGEEVLTPEQVALMQTQDINYIISKRVSEKRKLERLQSSLHLISSNNGTQNKHTFFVDSEKEKHSLDLAARLDTHPALLDRAYNRPRMSDLKKGKFSAYLDPEKAKLMRKETAKMYKELDQRMNREKKLAVLHRKMEMRALMKSEKNKPLKTLQKETTESAPVYIWAKERKR